MIFLLVTISNISLAKCVQPNGNYTGTFYGQFVNSDNGVVTNFASAVLTASFTKTGEGTVVEIGKSHSANGTYTTTWTIPAIDGTSHYFDKTTCSGNFESSTGAVYVYVVSNSGAKISGTYYGSLVDIHDKTILMNILTMEKI